MINIKELSIILKQKGYSEELAEATLCQDIILELLSKSRFKQSITIKGGVVMRNVSHSNRRATLDLDFDLIRYPLSDDFVDQMIKELNNLEGIKIKRIGKIEELRHQDYKGKRVNVEIEDVFHNRLLSKIDIGVHKYLTIDQTNYCFDLTTSSDGVLLLINSFEQMFTEKLKSLLRFGALSTRYKDIYDLCFLIDYLDIDKLLICFATLIFTDDKIKEKDVNDVLHRLIAIFDNQNYLNNLISSNKNWLGLDDYIVLDKIVSFFEKLL